MKKYGFVVFIIIAAVLFGLLVFIDAHKASLPEILKPRASQEESSEQQTDLVALAKGKGFTSIAGSNNGETSPVRQRWVCRWTRRSRNSESSDRLSERYDRRNIGAQKLPGTWQ